MGKFNHLSHTLFTIKPLYKINKLNIESNKLWVEIIKLLWAVYNNINFQGNFMIASKYYSESENVCEFYIITDKWIELSHTTKSNNIILLRDLWDNYYLVEDNNWKNIYKLDDNNVFNIVDNRLLNMDHTSINKLFKWEPTLINSNNETWIYVFDKSTWKLTKLIDVININLNFPEMDWDMMIITSEYWEERFFYKNWKLYKFKKWYTLHNWYFKKWFFGEKIILKNSFKDMEQYLNEIVIPQNITIA